MRWNLSFIPLLPFFLFATQKSENDMPPPRLPTRCRRTFTKKVTTYKRCTGWGINLLLSFPPESTCLNIFHLLNTAISDLTLDNSFLKHFIVVSLLCCFRGSNNRHDESSRERRNANRYLYPQREWERESERQRRERVFNSSSWDLAFWKTSIEILEELEWDFDQSIQRVLSLLQLQFS